MPRLSPNSVLFLDGKIVLSKRKFSTKWQARFKIGRYWLRISTKHTDLNEAKSAAEDAYMDARFRIKHDVPVRTKAFKHVAKLTIGRMQEQLNTGRGKKVYRDYIQAIQNYFIPFFGKYDVDKVGQDMLEQFHDWRSKKLGREPKGSTLSTHNSALNRVFDEALARGFINKTNVPQLQNKGAKPARRPDFTLDEYRKLFRSLRTWINRGRSGKSRDMRELLRDYVLILANTGIRHGTEAQNLRWKHISLIESKGHPYVAIWVRGKTGEREIVARHVCLKYFERIYSRCLDTAGVGFEEFLRSKSDLSVFRLPDGTATTHLNQTFRAFLREVDLLIDPKTGLQRTLYSLRHTYATFQIVYRKTDLHLLAKQMGTSILMLERHYSHLTLRFGIEQLAGERSLTK